MLECQSKFKFSKFIEINTNANRKLLIQFKHKSYFLLIMHNAVVTNSHKHKHKHKQWQLHCCQLFGCQGVCYLLFVIFSCHGMLECQDK
jgi:hypothetical protein